MLTWECPSIWSQCTSSKSQPVFQQVVCWLTKPTHEMKLKSQKVLEGIQISEGIECWNGFIKSNLLTTPLLCLLEDQKDMSYLQGTETYFGKENVNILEDCHKQCSLPAGNADERCYFGQEFYTWDGRSWHGKEEKQYLSARSQSNIRIF